MVKMLQLFSVMTVLAAGDDSTALLQQMLAREQSVGNSILTALAEGGEDTICVEAAVGDIAPVPGSFTATMSQQAVEVVAGTAAEENGSFCVQRQDVLLFQRTNGLHTANDIEAALSAKKTKTTTTTTTLAADVPPTAHNFGAFDFAGANKKVMVKQCPDKSSNLTQTMEATVSSKGNKASKNLNADQVRVCACRNFLKDGVKQVYGLLNDHAGEAKAVMTAQWKDVEGKVESDIWTGQIVADFGMVCRQAEQFKDWTFIAKMINHPTEVVPYFKAANVEGWEHCAKSWIIEGACAEIVNETSLLQNNALTEDRIDAATIHRATSDLPKATKHKVVNSVLGSEDLVEVFETTPTAERTALLVQLDTPQSCLAWVNQYRRTKGVPALTFKRGGYNVSHYMRCARGRAEQDGPKTSQTWQPPRDSRSPSHSWGQCGEAAQLQVAGSIAGWPKSCEDAITAYFHQGGVHRQILMDWRYKSIAWGYCSCSKFGAFWTHHFYRDV